MLEYGTPTKSAIRNAAAPMIGGMICPPVEEAASTAPANSGLVACVLHHRDCNRTGCYCVTYRGTGYHSTECRTDNRYLCRSTCIFSCNAVSQLNKEVGDSCSLQKRTENNKYHNIFRAYIYRCGENTLFCVEKIPHQEFHSSQKCRIGKPYSQCIDQEKT